MSANEESCPAMGTMGIHSDSYYDDGIKGRCSWCGATKQTDEQENEDETNEQN